MLPTSNPSDAPFCAFTDEEDGAVVLTLVGELDIAAAPVLRSVVSELIATAPARVSISLEAVTFADSSGLRAILESAEALRFADARVDVRPQVQRSVARCIEVAGVHRLIFGDND